MTRVRAVRRSRRSRGLAGIISTRMRRDPALYDIPIKYVRPELAEDEPTPQAVRAATGYGLGNSAVRAARCFNTPCRSDEP